MGRATDDGGRASAVRHTWILPLVGGLLLWAAFPPIGAFPLAWVALVPLILRLESPDPGRRQAWAAFLFGWAFGAAGMYWLYTVIPFSPPLVGIYFGLVALLFAGGYRLLRGWNFPIPHAAAIAWTFSEWTREWLFTGLPYLFLGHSQAPCLWLLQVADLGGVPLLTFLVAFANGAVASAIRSKRRVAWRAPAVAAALVASACGYGAWRVGSLETREALTVGVVQPNIAQSLKWTAPPHDWHEAHQRMTSRLVEAHGAPDLIVWPETSYLFPLCPLPDGDWRPILFDSREESEAEAAIMYMHVAGAPILFGVEAWEPRDGRAPNATREYRRYVSALLFVPGQGPRGRYDKLHLVPFGEYVPLGTLFPFVRRWIYSATGLNLAFEPGPERPPIEAAGRRLGTLVCFDAVFPSLSRRWARLGADVLVNISNEGWYRESAELDLMLDLCRFRCVETRRGMVRATNTGISAFVDPAGRVTAAVEGPEGTRRSVAGTLFGAARTSAESTAYVRFGDGFVLGCGGVLAGALAAAAVRRIRRFRREAK